MTYTAIMNLVKNTGANGDIKMSEKANVAMKLTWVNFFISKLRVRSISAKNKIRVGGMNIAAQILRPVTV